MPNDLVGAVIRLKQWKNYAAGDSPMETLKLRDKKKHVVAVVLAQIPFDMVIDEKFLEERMKLMGWVRDPNA